MLSKYNLVHTEGLKGLFYKGRFTPFDKIDDTMAAQLVGKTHVLELKPEAAAAAQEPAALPEATGDKKKAE